MTENVVLSIKSSPQVLNVGDKVRVKVGRGTLEGTVSLIAGDSANVYLTEKDRTVRRKLALIAKAEQIAA